MPDRARLEAEATRIRAQLAELAECSERTQALQARLDEMYADLASSRPAGRSQLIVRPIHAEAQTSLTTGSRPVYTMELAGSPYVVENISASVFENVTQSGDIALVAPTDRGEAELTPILAPFERTYNYAERIGPVAQVLGRGGIYQLMSFPINRFNGHPLGSGYSISFANTQRWLSGTMESRLFTITRRGFPNRFYSWDAHAPVGNTAHPYYHVNQKGMYQVFGHGNHAALPGGRALMQARQLRYMKIGGRVFLIAGVVVDTALMVNATAQSIEQGTPRPVAAQTIRTAGSWAAAWAGAKAGVAIGAAAGVETGPGLVLTAIGGGLIGGFLGYIGSDCIADLIYED